MADVTSGDIPPNIKKELETFITKQCLQLHTMERLLGTPERGKAVAEFMQMACGLFLKFNLPERELIVRFLADTHTAVHAAMVAVGSAKPMEAYKQKLDYLMSTSASLAKAAYEKGNHDN